jgi:hypothetical protein
MKNQNFTNSVPSNNLEDAELSMLFFHPWRITAPIPAHVASRLHDFLQKLLDNQTAHQTSTSTH